MTNLGPAERASVTDTEMDPADPGTWTARGRHPDDAAVIAGAWRGFPDLSPDAPLEERSARTRARTEAMRPVFARMDKRLEEERQARNFAFTQAQLAAGKGGDRDIVILRGRDEHGYGWDAAVQYGTGWYAAHAGWRHHGASLDRYGHASPEHRAAYDRGFADGGGCPDDIFDAARRANLAIERKSNQPPPARPPPQARGLPSSWPRPTDAPRPTAWSKRLLIIAAYEAQHAVGAAPAIDLFDNELFRSVRAQPGIDAAAIVILSAEHGFIEAHTNLRQYATVMTDERSAALVADLGERAKPAAFSRSRHPEDILVVASGEHLRIIDAHASVSPLCRTMEMTWDKLLVHRTHLRT